MSTPTPTPTAVHQALDKLMEQVQVYASAWSLVGGPFDSGDALQDALDAKADLRAMLYDAIASLPAAQGEQPLDPNESDLGVLWAEICRLRAAVAGPLGYATWQQAATAEKVRRVKAERELAAALGASQDSRTSSVAPGGLPLPQADSKEGFGDSVLPSVEPSGATLSPCAASQWISVDERLPEPGRKVLAFFRYPSTGKGRVVRALHAPLHTLNCEDWGDFNPEPDYDEATDATYWPEGWYESNEFEETNWALEHEPSHWMPLPEHPPQVDRGESSSEGGES